MGRERRWAGSASDNTQNNGNEESLQENIDYFTNFHYSLPKNYFEREELEYINRLIEEKKILVLYGMGGIGKTTLLTGLIKEEIFNKTAYFDLKNKDDFADVAKDILRDVFNETILNDDSQELIEKLVGYIEKNSILLVFDNMESIMDIGDNSGKILEEYRGYSDFFERILQIDSMSTIILSAREKIMLGNRYYDKYALYKLEGITVSQAQVLLKDYKLKGDDVIWEYFVTSYSGNPMSLKIVAYEIKEYFNANIKTFLEDPEIPHELEDLLNEQFERFSFLEKIILFWCAVERGSINERFLCSKIVGIDFSPALMHRMFQNIVNHCFLEAEQEMEDIRLRFYHLQPVIMDFLSQKLVHILANEIEKCQPKFISYIPLVDTVAKEYILNTQKEMFLYPLKDSILRFGEIECNHYLTELCKKIGNVRSYTVGNIISILSTYNEVISGWDFSSKFILNADLRHIKIVDCNFQNATFENVLLMHTFGNLIDAKFSYDDSLILGGATDYNIYAWDSRDLSFKFRLGDHTDWVRSVDSNHRYIASASNDEYVCVYDYNDYSMIGKFHEGSRVRKVVLSKEPDEYVYSSGDSKIIHQWCLADSSCKTFVGHGNVIWDFEIIEINEIFYIISVSDDKTAILWSVQDGIGEKILEYSCGIRTVKYDRKYQRLFMGCENGDIIVFSMQNRNIIQILKEHEGIVWGIDYDEKHEKLVSCSSDKHVIIWECSETRCCKRKVLDAHSSAIWNVHYNSDGTLFVTTGDDYEFKVWDANKYRMMYAVKGYTNLLRNIHVSNVNGTIYVAGDDTNIREYDLTLQDKAKRFFSGHTNRVRHIDVSNDGKKMLSCGDDGSVILWNLVTYEKKYYRGHEKRVWSVCFIDNTHFASAGEENDIYLWETNKSNPIAFLRGHTNWIWDISYNATQKMLISAGEDNTCRLWDVQERKEIHCFVEHKKWLFAASFDVFGRYAITASADHTANIYDINKRELICTLSGHKGWVWSAIFIEENIVATGSQDSTIRIWKIDYEQKMAICEKTLNKHTSWVVSLEYSKELKLLYSASADETVKIWSTDNYQYLGELQIDKPYDRMKIAGVKGLTDSEKLSMLRLGAEE